MRDLILRRVRIRLPRRLPRLTDGGERGAIGVLVAVLIGGGVLIGMGALVVDVGQLYQNRAELQNGADAAVLAVAKSCVEGTCTPSIAAQYGDANASPLTGGTAYVNVNQICGVNGTGFVGTGACDGSLKGCPVNPPAGTNYADVQTHTEMADGSYLLPPVFARALAGNGSYQGSTVYACAQAEWGAPSSATTIGFTISACSWDVYTNQGNSLAPPPPYSQPYSALTSLDQVVYEHGQSSNQTTCPAQYKEPSGSDGPGNFGWTNDPWNNCTVTINNSTYVGTTGASASSDCQTALYNAWSTESTVYLPVYTNASGSGNNLTYTLKGFAAFIITGYAFPGSKNQQAKEKDWVTGNYPCSGSNFCLSGFFTHGLVPSVGGLGGPNLGVYIVELTG